MTPRFTHTLITLAILLSALSACTTNDGDIGPLMGQWKLTEIRIDDATDTGYDGDIFWQFQSHVVSMRRTEADHTQHACFGSWKMGSDNTLELDFSHTDNLSPEQDFRYTPFPETRLPRGISKLTIKTLNTSCLKASYTDGSGTTITYSLVKW